MDHGEEAKEVKVGEEAGNLIHSEDGSN